MKKNVIPMLCAALLLSLAIPVANAQDRSGSSEHAHHLAAADMATIDVPAAAQAPVEVVEAFGEALAAGDFAAVESMLASDVIVLESGGAERSRREYLGHHAKADASFLAGVNSRLTHRRARVDGGIAWVASESELHTSKDGAPLTLLSTETMVLTNSQRGWRIVHIHWSSRPEKAI